MPPANDPLQVSEELERLLARAIEQSRQPTEDSPMRGLQRLAHLTESLTKSMDAEADEVADRLEVAHRRGKQAITRFRSHAESVEKSAQEVEDVLNQISNSPLSDSEQP